MWDEIGKPVLFGLVGFIFILFLIFWGSYKYGINIGEANIIKVFSKGELIYQGKKAFVNIESGGMTTTVTIYKQLFPWYVTDKIYSSSEITVGN